jgi:ElaB/YqjD/DUF883 family membrane-anchored ribosome-binding protein/uncharacterized membrane protein YtjA (UPF0391 family)
MLHYAVVFFVIALIAAFFGFGGIAVGAAGIAKILFIVFLIGAVVSLLMSIGRRACHRRRTHSFSHTSGATMDSVLDSAAARKAGNYANGQVNHFLDSVDDLTKALKDIDTPDVAKVRAKVKMALVAAKSAVADAASQIGTQAKRAGKRTDGFVRDNPWQVVGIAAVVGLAVGILSSRRS